MRTRTKKAAPDLAVIIPAAGMSRRHPGTHKSLAELRQGETVLGRTLRLVRGLGRAEVLVVVGYQAERVVRGLPPSVRVIENERPEETNVVRSLHMGVRATTARRVLVIYGDLVLGENLLQGLPSDCSWVLASSTVMGRHEVGLNVVDGEAGHFEFGLPLKWCHVVHFVGDELKLLRKLSGAPERARWFGFELLNLIIEEGGHFDVLQPLELQLCEIDYPKDVERARRIP